MRFSLDELAVWSLIHERRKEKHYKTLFNIIRVASNGDKKDTKALFKALSASRPGQVAEVDPEDALKAVSAILSTAAAKG